MRRQDFNIQMETVEFVWGEIFRWVVIKDVGKEGSALFSHLEQSYRRDPLYQRTRSAQKVRLACYRYTSTE